MKFSTFAGLALAAAILAPIAASAADAPAAFTACKGCHKVEAGAKSMGPSLFGVVGRKSGSLDGYSYSPAMAAYGKTWDAATLSAYITDPKAAVPGNKMGFAGVKDAAKVTEIVGYLSTLK
jgi:cytochrome c